MDTKATAGDTKATAGDFEPRILAERSAKLSLVAATQDANITAGFKHSPDGKRMSINLEYVAGAFLVEHYVEETSERLRCGVQLTSTLLMDNEFTTAHVIRSPWPALRLQPSDP